MQASVEGAEFGGGDAKGWEKFRGPVGGFTNWTETGGGAERGDKATMATLQELARTSHIDFGGPMPSPTVAGARTATSCKSPPTLGSMPTYSILSSC